MASTSLGSAGTSPVTTARKHDAGIAHYVPINLGETPDYYRRFIDPIDVAILKVGPKDADGVYNFGGTHLVASCDCGVREDGHCRGQRPPALRHVATYVVCTKARWISLSMVMAHRYPSCRSLPLTDIDRTIGRLIAAEIENGSCLQVGIGGMPNAVCASLLDSDVHDLGIHTEMLTDAMADLVSAGRVTGLRKTLDPGKHTYSFALGGRRLYDTIDQNADFYCCPADYTNMPHNIMQNDRAVAINSTTQIDITGQAASESDGFRHISGTGGQLQFVRGAYAAPNGKSFICLPSVFEKGDIRRSRIVVSLTPGNTVTTPRMDTMYVATEYGMVNLKGQSSADRAKLLISIAHPDFREDLEREAREKGVIPKRL